MMVKLAIELGYFNLSLFQEVQSLTTIQNIRFLRDFNVIAGMADNCVTLLERSPEGIICDQDRAYKARYILDRIWSKDIPVIGFNFHRTPKEKALILAGTAKDIAAIHSPRLEELLLNQRKREIGIA